MNRFDAVGDHEPAVAIARYLYRDEAEVAKAHLDAEGIAAIVSAEDEGGLNPGFYRDYRVVLLVSPSETEAARQVLGLEQPLVIPIQVRQAMLNHSGWAYPNEACGLLAGAGNEVHLVFCLTNRLHSAVGYTIDPREHFGAMRYAERQGLSILGAWHSHPAGDAMLSSTDIAQSPGGDWVTVVVGNRSSAAGAIRAFRTETDVVVERPVVEQCGDR